MNTILLKDFYKVGHYEQYPPGSTLIFNNFTPRKSRMPGVNHSVFFGLTYFMKAYLQQSLIPFFVNDKSTDLYSAIINETLGCKKYPDHIAALHKLGYLPLDIYALPEGAVVPCGVPALVMHNTLPEFYWLPNMLETVLSCTLWGSCTSATIAREYRLLLDKFAAQTSDMPEFVDYQAHDFSMRGMSSVESACISGIAHLQYFKGTDTLPAMLTNLSYYNKPLHICSVPATEHSVASAYGLTQERIYFQRLITDVYPTGIVSIVADSYNLWNFIYGLEMDKELIMQRDGKVVIRPDSGDPVEILCGTNDSNSPLHISKGVIEILWNIFGGTINSKGYKQLDSHIGCIYGDSITLERAEKICSILQKKGFASTNIVFGVGSYTYQYNTRDTLGWAMKATYAEINGEPRALTKDPITDDGTKKSHSGLLKVVKIEGSHGYTYKVLEDQSWEKFHQEDNELKLVFHDGKIIGE